MKPHKDRKRLFVTYILYNPLANGGNGTEGLDAILSAFPGAALCNIIELDINEFLTALPADDQVILCGGDGTLHHLVNDLADPAALEVPVYVWKFGTGNDFWRDAPEKKEKEMVLLNDYMKNLPTVRINGRSVRFLNNCGLGIDGRVCEMGEEKKRKKGGKVSYAAMALKAILYDYKCARARVTVDGVTKEYDKVWLATAMNGKYFGGGMKITPDQDRRGDKLCCIVWHKTARPLALPLFISVFPGLHVHLKSMFDLRWGSDIQVEFDRPCAVNLDGEVTSGVLSYSAGKGPASRPEPALSKGAFYET